MNYGTIYKITNTKTGKIYIGKTTKSLNDRLQGHINSADKGNNFKLSRAIRKYGKENFIIEPIDVADTRNELNEKEIYYIKKYNSLEDGYNMTIGGEGGNTYIDKSDEEMKAISEKNSAALHKNNGNRGQLVGPKNSMYGKHHTPEAKEKMSKALKGKNSQKNITRKYLNIIEVERNIIFHHAQNYLLPISKQTKHALRQQKRWSLCLIYRII